MKVALIGASGNVGSRILAELSARGHAVTALVRNPERIAALPGVTAAKLDVFDKAAVTEAVREHDAVISAVHFSASDPTALLAAIKASGVARYLVVGGAGSLEAAPGLRVIDTPDFPDTWKAEAGRGAEFLDELRAENELDWTFLSPAALIGDGERTGQFRLGTDQLLVDGEGQSRISYADYAIAMVDELENPAHSRRRFTVAY